jgi:hypothetical protein
VVLLRLHLPDFLVYPLNNLIDREARWRLAWRIFDEGLEECRSPPDSLEGYIAIVIPPLVIFRARDLGMLKRVHS